MMALAAIFLLQGAPVFASDHPAPADERAASGHEAPAETHSSASADTGLGFGITGFLETAYHNVPNHDESTFLLEQAELDITKDVGDIGGFRIDLQHLVGEETNGDNVLEQGYVWVGVGPAVLSFGKFNAPIGWELLDPNEMLQFSHAMVFDYGLPTNLTGAMVSGSAGDMIDYSVYVVNGWDNNGDDNTDKTFGGRLGVTPMEGLNIGFSFISGNENGFATEGSGGDTSHDSTPAEDTSSDTTTTDTSHDTAGAAEEPVASGHFTGASASVTTAKLTVFDVDVTYEPMEHLTIGFELNIGTFDGQSLVTPGDDAKWTGFLLVGHYVFANHMGVTLRYDSFHDEGGARFGNAVDETRNSFTIAPLYHMSHELEFLAEYRQTTSNENTFHDKDGNSKDSESSLAFKMVYQF